MIENRVAYVKRYEEERDRYLHCFSLHCTLNLRVLRLEGDILVFF